MNKVILISSALFLASSLSSSQADWQETLGSAAGELIKNEEVTQAASSLLTNSDMTDGLKEALANGVESAINRLSQKGGFMENNLVKIPLPNTLKLIEKSVRELGQGEYADQFIGTMNHAAEEAVPEAAILLGEAIREMSVEDATKIVNGPDDAATQYFRKVSSVKLAERFQPIIQKATSQFGVASSYKTLIEQASPLLKNDLVDSPLLGALLPTGSLDLDQYVTNKTLDGLFKYIAIEEKRIRDNPSARTTDLLKKVFSGQ